MPKNRIIIVLGVIIALLPIIGFPRGWESVFQVVAGLGIVLISIWSSIDKRLALKAKAQKRQMHKRQLGGEQAEILDGESGVEDQRQDNV